MPSKMVTNFRRSLSFPNPPSQPSSSSSSSSSYKPRKTTHVRSTSLPCGRSHPIISQLNDSISNLNTTKLLNTSSQITSNWIRDTLSQLKYIHETLDDLLRIPQTRESFRACGTEHSRFIQKLLDDFLRLVDVYGTFQMLVLNLKREYSSLQICVRRKDEAKLATHAKNLDKISNEIGNLVLSLPSVGKLSFLDRCNNYGDEAEIMEVVNDVLKVTLGVSLVLFGGLSRCSTFKRGWEKIYCMGLGRKVRNVKAEGWICAFEDIFNLESLRKMNEDHEVKVVLSKKMEEFEVCVVEIEGCGEKVFRSLISARVSLLNVITQ